MNPQESTGRLATGTAKRLAGQLKNLADPVRVRLLSIIVAARREGVSAGEVAEAFDLTKPTVSHHLKVLGEAGLVTRERSGTHIIYRPTSAARRLHTVLRGIPGEAAAEREEGLRSVLDELDGGWRPAAEEAGASAQVPVERPLPGLLDPEDLLERVQERLTIRFAGVFTPETVHRYLRDSYERLSHSAAVTAHLPALTERFAAERLASVARCEGLLHKVVPEVLFVCVRNAGRSQMAAALLRHLAGDRVQIRSAGSAPGEGVDPDVAAVMTEIGIDLGTEFPKPLTDEVVHSADIVITMGCGDACPVYLGKRYLDWEIPEPLGESRPVIRLIRDEVDRRIRRELLPGLLG
ncbi:metalloregulator ArsR/SmtB family transcription factor [Allosalinactinospora lopnorensis]|uniref:metalloregulator ArsR/SmtB family transcription factor n=1 Tax=Allosalinactinospora lopnorensis TaxID=1352348 RepID=UPI0009E2C3AE|nr:metalloregulator ArsR/SmtB family transcription factor [Allosalinactinospora lopnorensis]